MRFTESECVKTDVSGSETQRHQPSPPQVPLKTQSLQNDTEKKLWHVYCTSTAHLYFWIMHIAKQITAETFERALILMKAFMKLRLAPLLKPSDVRHCSFVSCFQRKTSHNWTTSIRRNRKGWKDGFWTNTLSYLEKKQCNPVFVPCFIDH